MANKKISISFTEGRVVRDLFQNGLPELLASKGFTQDYYTPAARVPSFTRQWQRTGVNFYPLKPYVFDRKAYQAQEMRKHILRHAPRLLPAWLDFEKRTFIQPDPEYVELLRAGNPGLLVVTNPMQHHEQPVFGAAQALGIPTLGVIRSWDNLFKGLRIRPDTLAVWNPVNRQEAVDLMKYPPQKVEMVGATQFDAYFDPAGMLDRADFAASFDLDPARPILTLATLGPFQHQYDETYLMDWLIDEIRSGGLPRNSQLVCRLHPASRLEQFLKYREFDFVRLSWNSGYIPSLAWTMTREEVYFVGNLLRHSDVVISPGSTITIETAIFDTPTVVPVFHTYQPELGKLQFDQHFTRHFQRLQELDLVPVVQTPEALREAIAKALSDRTWYSAQRARLVKDYVFYTDGKSTQRLAELISRLAGS